LLLLFQLALYLSVVHPLPFPKGAWEGWWARPGVYEPQLLGGEVIPLLACFGLRALPFLQSVAAFELSYFREVHFDI